MKNSLYLWIAVLFLSAAFLFVSLFLWFSGGQNKYFLARKLRLGALIIGMTGVMNGCRPPVVTCYKPAMIPQVVPVQKLSDGKVKVQEGFEFLEFNCEMLYDDTVAWKLTKTNNLVEKGNCLMRNEESNVILVVKPINSIKSGNYTLELFHGSINELGVSQIAFMAFDIEVEKK